MGNYSANQLRDVWNKAIVVIEDQKDLWRKDFAGAWICWDNYGDATSLYGWSVDHAKPVAKGGADGSTAKPEDFSNWMPLQFENNLKKSDDYPAFQTAISSDGNKNVAKIQNWKY